MNCDKKCHEILKYVGQKLIEAAKEGYTEEVQELLNIGINPNFQDKYGMTALMLALFNGHLDIGCLLLEKKADVNLQSKSGFTALIEASYRGNMDIIRILI